MTDDQHVEPDGSENPADQFAKALQIEADQARQADDTMDTAQRAETVDPLNTDDPDPVEVTDPADPSYVEPAAQVEAVSDADPANVEPWLTDDPR